MPHDPEKYLYDMANSCRFLVGYVSGRSFDDFRTDRGFRSAIERELQIIGEALLQLTKVSMTIAQRISDYNRIIRFRHVLVHGYDRLNQDVEWYIVTERIPVLLGELEDLLGCAE